jgi:hypothetical protein
MQAAAVVELKAARHRTAEQAAVAAVVFTRVTCQIMAQLTQALAVVQ